ncbi:MAG: MGH1-like glycoside hydrolase domain-containing protein [Mangrovibacterium sp.]
MKNILKFALLAVVVVSFAQCADNEKEGAVLKYNDYKHYVDYFNEMEDENIAQAIPNSESWAWMEDNIPLFSCPQENFEEMYYFRWWTYRKHIKETPVGWGITEFLINRPYADKWNLIACAIGHHTMEGRWLHNAQYTEGNINTWLRGNEGKPMKKLHKFSSWTAYALLQAYYVNNDQDFIVDMLPDLIGEYQKWEAEKRLPSGLFWQEDVRDGMEEQISGGRRVKNIRPTINSYMYGNAVAISEIAQLAGDTETANLYAAKADTLKALVNDSIWNDDAKFFETIQEKTKDFAQVREAIGFIPWYFHIPDASKGEAWDQINLTDGFLAPYGLTTAERRHPDFRSHGCCRCEWDGPIWPFASSQTLVGLANYLNDYEAQPYVNDSTYFAQMELYVESQYHRGRPYVGEYLDEVTGYWLKGDQERSRYYNHSTFNDLMISGLVGLRPQAGNTVVVNPLIPAGKWDWFCLDQVKYHDKMLTIVWDKTGEKYGNGVGLYVLADGKEIGRTSELTKLTCEL